MSALKSGTIYYHALLVQAYLRLRCEHREEGLQTLREAFGMGRELGYYVNAQWAPRQMSRLCIWALDAGVEVQYAQQLIRDRGLTPESQSQESWPWKLRIRTLGEFTIEVHGQPLAFPSKVPKKLLGLVKAMIALGAREVPEQALCDALWPDEDGDASHRAFTIALHRLRKLLGGEPILTQRDGRISLDLSACWVDMLAFEQYCAGAEGARQAGDLARFEDIARQAIELYRGSFLAKDPDAAWTASQRELLSEKFVHLVGRVGAHFEAHRRHDEAVSLYIRGLESDSLAESFYQGLMRCHRELGQRAEALSTYRRMRQVLSVTLGIQPSPGSEALYRSLAMQ